MDQKSINILLVEDSESLSVVYKGVLTKSGYQVTVASTGEEALNEIKQQIPDIILLDLELPDIHGKKILEIVKEQSILTSVIIITAHGSVDVAVETMRLGAVDFLTKPFDANRLLITIKNVSENIKLHRMVEEYQDTFARKEFHSFKGSALSMQAVYRIIQSAAPSKASVFITGESGTGKELCAEAIHNESNRKDNQFIPLNCAAIPRDLMESEIFGHVRGAFTGAQKERDGAAMLANGGTLFLDEICEMDLDLQSKLLRFIQTGQFQKVGSSKIQQSDIRFVCATNRDPLEEVKAGRFREDLYYRLHVIPIQLPPLRERESDVILIAEQFLKQFSTEEGKDFKSLSSTVKKIFLDYKWPGNVRELQNIIRNIVVLNNGKVVENHMLPFPLDQLTEVNVMESEVLNSSDAADRVEESPSETIVDNENEIIPLWRVEQQVINAAIKACNGNIPQAAAKLEVSPSTIYRKKQSWGE
jgi:DNA-binding NtrC family response regulator